MVSTPKKKSGVIDAKQPGIERFFKPPQKRRQTGSDDKEKSTKDAVEFSIRKRPPSPNGVAESSVRRNILSENNNGKSKRQRQTSLEANFFTFQKQKSPQISFSIADEVKERIEQRIDLSLLERDSNTVPANQSIRENLVPISNVQLNAEQQRVVESSPYIPLSVSACAGTGKTRTMVQRAISFINNHGINPQNILIVTFSKLATEEVVERVTRAFGRETDLPTIKTFHALAYSWVIRTWKLCGLSQRPSILNPNSGEIALMKQVLERIVDNQRLERCLRKLKLVGESNSWEDVVNVFQTKYEDVYDELVLAAEKEAESLVKKNKKKKDMRPEEEDAIRDEVKAKKKFLLRKMCYLKLLERDYCDLERRWIGTKQECRKRCKDFVDFVRKARHGSHEYNEYPFEDAQVWQIYDQLQRETGRIDFDTMLILFAENVLSNKLLAEQFHERYTHVIVDEYQDNSQMQAQMLKKIVQKGCLTVVGDEDQCIYEFRGASPGNFDRLKKDFAKLNIQVQEEVLIDNYRSSKNILTVASSFLEGDTWRHPKTLRSTKPDGIPVELWECSSQDQQAGYIVDEMIKRHEDDKIRWKDMAVLFRCMKMGSFGPITSHLQKKLAEKKVPFDLAGGKSLFERASVRDLVAYLQLSIRSSPNDEAFERCINQPPRKLPKDKVVPIIKDFLDDNTSRKERDNLTRITFLQEAAEVMVKRNVGLTNSRHKAMSKFLAEIKTYQEKVNILSLPDLLRYLWKESGLSEFYRNKNYGKGKTNDIDEVDEESETDDEGGVDEESNDDDDDSNDNEDDSDESEALNPTEVRKASLTKCVVAKPCISRARAPRAVVKPEVPKVDLDRVYYPLEIRLLIDLAVQHINDWQKREKMLKVPQSVPSLLDLARSMVLENRTAYSFESLPDHVVDEIILAPAALGRSVIDEFLSGLMLQHSAIERQPHDFAVDDRVIISSVHRAKGLEWSDVYIPFLNEDFLPTSYRDEDIATSRHMSNCDALNGQQCNKDCANHFSTEAAKERGDPEERHLNEERRLAHVAASRAKEKLVLLSVDEVYSYEEKCACRIGKSSFLDNISNHVTIKNKR